jgi:beta-xylosidase
MKTVRLVATSPAEVERIPLTQTNIFLKAECDFKNRTDKAHFFYSLDSKSWAVIGSQLKSPVFHGDYHDPDIIRVINDFYKVFTTFAESPGITVLQKNLAL